VGKERLARRPKKADAENAHVVLIDETGLFLNPVVRRTWARRGKTPVLVGDGGGRKKVSAIGAVTVSPAARRLGFDFATLPGGYFDAGAVVAFLRELLRYLPGQVVVVWDNGSNHGGPLVRPLLRRTRRLTLVRLPPYCPHRNPVEAVWSWLKYGQSANDFPPGVAELDDEVVDRLIELKFDPGLLRVLWGRSDRPFPVRQTE